MHISSIYDLKTSTVGWFLWYINLCRLFNTKSIFKQIISSISNNSVKYEYTVELSKTFLFQTIQFSQTILIQTNQFCITIVFVHTELNVKTVLFQAIQLCISMPFSSMGPYQVLLLQAIVDLGAMTMKRYSAFPKAPALLETHHQIVLYHISRTLVGDVFIPLQRCSQCSLQPQPTGQVLIEQRWMCNRILGSSNLFQALPKK